MPNVVRGERMSGLMTYLVGPGKRNEHENPHLIAGDPASMAWAEAGDLSHDSALAIARHLDRPRVAYGTEVPGGHVWHCSLSISAEEGLLSDQTWNQIATDFVTSMGFDNTDGTVAPCRWVAVRHGLSSNGNDHIHLAVNLVREDGTRAPIHHDYHRAQVASRALEVTYGLAQLESAQAERSTRGYDPAEIEAQARARARGKYENDRLHHGAGGPMWEQLDVTERQGHIAAQVRTDQPRHALARSVRGAATASESEAEFVRRMRRSGLLVRARFAEGRTDVVTGYSVAARPEHGERPIWYGGGRLARDLTLTRLRDRWPDTPSGASEAAAEWNAALRGRRVVSPGRELTTPDPQMWDRYTREITELRERLRSVPVDDRDTWAMVAREAAGALAAWSNATEPEPGHLAAASDALATSAQTFRRPLQPQRVAKVSLTGAAMLLASATTGGQGAVAQAVMLRQLVRLAQALFDASRAAGQAQCAAQIAAAERDHFRAVAARLPRTTTTATATTEAPITPDAATLRRIRGAQLPATQAITRTPGPAETTSPRPTERPGADHAPER